MAAVRLMIAIAGTRGLNPLCSAGESVLTSAQPPAQNPAPWRRLRVGWETRRGRAGRELAPWPFLLCRALMQSHLGRATPNELNAGIAAAADRAVYQKKEAASTRSKFVQNVRLFSQLRFKAHHIGGLGQYYQSGILWSAYPIKL
jgi:hypothetical protein